jgi:sulfide:quinone oxidoreductase
MKRLVILGAGTAGTMLVNRMRRRIPRDWYLSVVDPEPIHLYQPGLLFLPFGAADEARMRRPRRTTLGRSVDWIEQPVTRVELESRRVHLGNGDSLRYDLLVIATGSRIRPEETPGMIGPEWRRSVHDFYTLEGAQALRASLAGFKGGRLVVNVVEMPIKCPVAPLEFLFLADDYFTRRRLRAAVELVYATPLDDAFTKPAASRALRYLLERKRIRLETEFSTGEVDAEKKTLRSYDGREIGYELLVTIPTHGGAPFIETSGLGNELGFVPTDPKTLLSKAHDDVFVLGDAADLPTSKAGSVAHFQSEILADNLERAMEHRSLEEDFDGHANCFIETGRGKALLIDFNYATEPLPGEFPLPGIGPFRLLRESRINHLGKLAFRSLYWNVLLPARPLPLSPRMSLAGKHPTAPGPPDATQEARHVA